MFKVVVVVVVVVEGWTIDTTSVFGGWSFSTSERHIIWFHSLTNDVVVDATTKMVVMDYDQLLLPVPTILPFIGSHCLVFRFGQQHTRRFSYERVP